MATRLLSTLIDAFRRETRISDRAAYGLARRASVIMPQLHIEFAPRLGSLPGNASNLDDPFTDHLALRARNRLHREPAPTRVIEVGEMTAGIAVPEESGVRFFSSRRDFDPLDGTVFPSVEQAAKAVRVHFRERTRPGRRPSGRPGALRSV